MFRFHRLVFRMLFLVILLAVAFAFSVFDNRAEAGPLARWRANRGSSCGSASATRCGSSQAVGACGQATPVYDYGSPFATCAPSSTGMYWPQTLATAPQPVTYTDAAGNVWQLVKTAPAAKTPTEPVPKK